MRATDHATDRVISIEVFQNEVSKTDVLTQGDEVGVFSSIEGTEQYFLEHVKFVVGSDGRSLLTTPAVYYPEAKQAVRFFACFPYHTGLFSVPTDQTTSLKQADLCWATASSTPVASAVPLQFEHKMARLLIATNEPTTKIVIPNAFSGGTLHIKTGVFTPTTKSSISTSGTELILPAQTVTRLVLTVAGVEYVFEGAISLETAKTTSISLTLSPTQKTATLSGSSTTNWTTVTRSGDSNSPIINQLKLHWVAPHADYAKADKVTLTVENPTTKATQDVDVTPTLISGESTASVCAYTLPVSLAAGSGFWYPYTVTRARIYQGATLLREAIPEAMRGTTIYRSGAQSLAINMYIQVRDAATNTTEIKEWLNVDKDFGSMLVKITTVGCDNWTAVVEGGDGVNVQPSSGTSGQTVRINWSPNLTNAAKTNRVIKFSPAGVPTAFTPIATTQQAGPTTKAVLINGVYWATGNLIADGANGCKIGVAADAGIYFQFGSLIGWRGGVAPNYDGTGVITSSTPVVKVKPLHLNVSSDPGVVWPSGGSTAVLNRSYFSVTAAPYNGTNSNIHSYAGAPLSGVQIDATKSDLLNGRYAPMGVGDPCAYYLGSGWKMPTYDILRLSWGLTSLHPYTFQSPSNVILNTNRVTVKGVSYLFNVFHYRLFDGQFANGVRNYSFFPLATLTTYSEPSYTLPSPSLATFDQVGTNLTYIHTWSGHSSFTTPANKTISGMVIRCVL